MVVTRSLLSHHLLSRSLALASHCLPYALYRFRTHTGGGIPVPCTVHPNRGRTYRRHNSLVYICRYTSGVHHSHTSTTGIHLHIRIHTQTARPSVTPIPTHTFTSPSPPHRRRPINTLLFLKFFPRVLGCHTCPFLRVCRWSIVIFISLFRHIDNF